MTSLRKYVYAGLLAVTTLSIAPTLASAQTSRGQFTLAHDVLWQNTVVPAGEYRYSFEPDGPNGFLILSRMTSPRAGYMLLVTEKDDSSMAGIDELVLQNTSDGSYVSAMKLPEIGATLHFAAPKATRKAVAKTSVALSGSGQ